TSHVQPGCPPTLLIQGKDDAITSVTATNLLFEQLVAAGVPAVNMVFPMPSTGSTSCYRAGHPQRRPPGITKSGFWRSWCEPSAVRRPWSWSRDSGCHFPLSAPQWRLLLLPVHCHLCDAARIRLPVWVREEGTGDTAATTSSTINTVSR